MTKARNSSLDPRGGPLRCIQTAFLLIVACCMVTAYGEPTATAAPDNEATTVTNAQIAENWMGYAQSYFQDKTLWELSLPGTHDTLTYDLSTTTSRTAIDSKIGAAILKIFTETPNLPGKLAGEFMRLQAVTQTLSVTEQLDAGVRFLDFRASYEENGWFGYHFVITNHKMDVYIQELAEWLKAHPTEMVVVWFSHHGSTCKKNQFRFANSEAFQQISESFKSALASKLVNPATDGHPSQTTYADYQKKGRQVVLFLSDHSLFDIEASLDACTTDGAGGIDNRTGADVTQAATGFEWELAQYADWAKQFDSLKKAGTLSLMSGSTSTPEAALKWQALLHFLGVDTSVPPAYAWLHHCRNVFDFPKDTKTQMSCPPTLHAFGQMTNFYSQRSMNYILNQMRTEPKSYRTPVAMYLDGMLSEGRFDTSYPGQKPPSAYAYLGTLLKSATTHSPCSGKPGSAFPAVTCKQFDALVTQLLDAAPYKDYANANHGRIKDWPPLPNAIPACLHGYTEVNGQCFLQAYVALQGNMCTGEYSCQAPFDGMCSDGWTGHSHGNCAGNCYDDCIVGANQTVRDRITGATKPLLHSIVDPAKYFVCNLSGEWVSFPQAFTAIKNGQAGPFTFNNGGSAGKVDPYLCSLPGPCVTGYKEHGGNCYLEAYVSYTGNECPSHCSSPNNACSSGWLGHSHGSCELNCYDDCIVDLSAAFKQRIEVGQFHTIKDPNKYFVCDLANAQWQSFPQAATMPSGDFQYNNGHGAGHKDGYPCAMPGPCAGGYELGSNGNCYLKAYVSYKGDECPDHCSSPSGACSIGWRGHSHGNCFTGCRNDCIVEDDQATADRIRDGALHTITDLDKYFVCNTSGHWVSFPDAEAGHSGDLEFNTGRGKGSKDQYKCKTP